MIYNTVSGKQVIARVITDFRPDFNEWQTKAPLWIVDALDRIGSVPTLTDATPLEVEVENHKFRLPCDLKLITAIEYYGNRVERKNVVNKTVNPDRETSEAFYEVLGDGWAWFSKADDSVTIHYKTVPLEFDKVLQMYIPRVPDDVKVISACAWYIIMMMLQTGYMHPVFDLNSKNEITNPFMRWEKERKSAANSIGKFDADSRDMASKMIRDFITDPYAHYTKAFEQQFSDTYELNTL